MKKSILLFLRNTLLTTSITLLILGCAATLLGGSCIFIKTIFQNLLVNACIHLGFLVTKNFEAPYFLLEAVLDVTVLIGIVLLAGAFFGWFSSTPVWVLIVLSILTYAISSLFQIFRVRDDIQYINQKLKSRWKE